MLGGVAGLNKTEIESLSSKMLTVQGLDHKSLNDLYSIEVKHKKEFIDGQW